MIEINKLTKKFGQFIALDSISVKITEGESVCLLGENGAGKSTLIKCILGKNKFSVDEKHIVETNVAIPKVSQSFDTARRDQYRYPGTDFSSIVAHPNPNAILKNANEQATDRYHHNDWS